MRHFDVQLIGGVVLHQGKIAEMRTGEGKTLVRRWPRCSTRSPARASTSSRSTTTSPAATRSGWGRSSTSWGSPSGMITATATAVAYVFEPGYPDERRAAGQPAARSSRREAYAADVTYGTNNEFGFDYLRDNMVVELEQRVQRERSLRDRRRGRQHPHRRGAHAADHQWPGRGVGGHVLHVRPPGAPPARAPRGPGRGRPKRAATTSSISRTRPSRPPRRASTRSRARSASQNLYDADPTLARHFEQALRAHALYKRDRDYIVKDGEIIIVDEFTGRQMPGRRWSEGLHQAIEAKEGLRVQRETVTLATITFQNYFRLYDKLAGMTGTAMTEAEEFHKIYTLEVVGDPDPPADGPRRTTPTSSTATRRASSTPSIDEIEEMQAAGRPVLVGTVSVEKSEKLVRDARAARHQARGPERQVPREGSRGSSPRPGGVARSRSPRTWPAAARTSCSAATRRGSPRICSIERA